MNNILHINMHMNINTSTSKKNILQENNQTKNENFTNIILEQISEASLFEFYATYHTPAVGASGAIYGILVAFGLSFPNSKLALIFFPVPIAAKYFIPAIILGDLFFGMTKYSIGNVAHFAHVGGALIGFLIAWYWKQNQFKRWN